MKNILKLLVINVLLLLAVTARGQTTLQVVTKVMENTFPYKNGTEVNIEGEKAEIKVETWNRSEVKVLVELISKNTDKKIAQSDLDLMVYSSEQAGKNLYFRNYMSTAKLARNLALT